VLRPCGVQWHSLARFVRSLLITRSDYVSVDGVGIHNFEWHFTVRRSPRRRRARFYPQHVLARTEILQRHARAESLSARLVPRLDGSLVGRPAAMEEWCEKLGVTATDESGLGCRQLQYPRWRAHGIEFRSFLRRKRGSDGRCFDVPPQVVAAMEGRASAVDVDALTSRHRSWHPEIPT
jgi:hypothetical protein